MNKALFGFALVGVGFLVAYLTKEEKQEYVEMNVTEDGETVEVKKEKSVRKIDEIKEKAVTKIKEKGIDKKIDAAVAKVVAFIIKNKEKIEAVTIGLSLVSGVIGVMTAATKLSVESNKKARMDANEVLYSSLFDEAKERKHPVFVSDDLNKNAEWVLSYCEERERVTV